MNEGFDLNKKIDSTEYRKTLADKLRGTIQTSGFEEARNQLEQEKEGMAEKYNQNDDRERPKSLYEKSKISQLAKWLLEKNPGEFNRDEIEEQTKKFKFRLGHDVLSRIDEYFRNKNIEAIPNLEKLQGNHSNIILQQGKDNKFVLINIIKPELNKEKLYESIFNEKDFLDKEKTMYENYYRKTFLENGEEELIEALIDTSNLNQKELTSIFIARPYEHSFAFGQRGGKMEDLHTVFEHFQIKDEFMENRDLERVKVVKERPYSTEDRAPLILRKNEVSTLNNFFKEIAKIIEEESDPIEAQKKVEKIPFPVFEEGVSGISGGYVELTEDGTIKIYGSSERFGSSNKNEIVNMLSEDFPDKKFEC